MKTVRQAAVGEEFLNLRRYLMALENAIEQDDPDPTEDPEGANEVWDEVQTAISDFECGAEDVVRKLESEFKARERVWEDVFEERENESE